MRNCWLLLLGGLGLGPWGVACDDGGDSPEADTDTDSDTDTDGDTDPDTDPNCPLNSGWPCTCDVKGDLCDDGTDCVGVQDLGNEELGICSPTCKGQDDTSTCSSDYDAQAFCLLSDGKAHWCLLYCSGDGDCPADQSCQSAGASAICYP